MQLLPWINKEGNLPLLLSEKESNRIGRLNLPPSIQKALGKDRHIKLICNLQERVKRLKRDYIDHLNTESKAYCRERLTYLKKTLSGEKLTEYLELFDNDQWDLLVEKILVEYYDLVYKQTSAEPIECVNSTDIDSAVNQIQNILAKREQLI